MSYYEYTMEQNMEYYPLPNGSEMMMQPRSLTMSITADNLDQDEVYVRGTKELVTWIQFTVNGPKMSVVWISQGPNGIKMRLES